MSSEPMRHLLGQTALLEAIETALAEMREGRDRAEAWAKLWKRAAKHQFASAEAYFEAYEGDAMALARQMNENGELLAELAEARAQRDLVIAQRDEAHARADAAEARVAFYRAGIDWDNAISSRDHGASEAAFAAYESARARLEAMGLEP